MFTNNWHTCNKYEHCAWDSYECQINQRCSVAGVGNNCLWSGNLYQNYRYISGKPCSLQKCHHSNGNFSYHHNAASNTLPESLKTLPLNPMLWKKDLSVGCLMTSFTIEVRSVLWSLHAAGVERIDTGVSENNKQNSILEGLVSELKLFSNNLKPLVFANSLNIVRLVYFLSSPRTT